MLKLKNKVTVNNSSLPCGVALTPKNYVNMSVEEFESICKFYPANRGTGTDLERAEEIADSIYEEGTWWMVQPVVVDEKTNIVLDGNHTGHALIILSKKYNLEVPVTVEYVSLPKGTSIPFAVQSYNNNRKGWTLEMYILNHIAEGNENYKRLEEIGDILGYPFKDEKNKKRWRYIAALSGSGKQSQLKEGKFKLSKDEMQEYIQRGRDIVRIWEAAGKPKISTWFEGFIIGYVTYMDFFGGKPFITEQIVKNAQTESGRALFDGSVSKEDWRVKFLTLGK